LKDHPFGADGVPVNQGALKIKTNHHLHALWAYTKTGSCGPDSLLTDGPGAFVAKGFHGHASAFLKRGGPVDIFRPGKNRFLPEKTWFFKGLHLNYYQSDRSGNGFFMEYWFLLIREIRFWD